MKFTSTYLRLTVSNLLSSYGVTLSPEESLTQAENSSTYYRKLFRVPAALTLADINFVQFQDTHESIQEKLMAVIFSNLTPTAEGEAPTDLLSISARNQVEKLQTEFDEEENRLKTLRSDRETLQAKTTSFVVGKLNEWHQANQQLAETVTQQLSAAGAKLPANFAAQLAKQLNLSAAGMELTDSQLRQYGASQTPGIATRAVIGLLLKNQSNITLPQQLLSQADSQLAQALVQLDHDTQQHSKNCYDLATNCHSNRTSSFEALSQLQSLAVPPQIRAAINKTPAPEIMDIDPAEHLSRRRASPTA